MKNNNISGFTLVEMAMVLAIVGIIMGGVSISFAQYIQQENVVKTRKKLDTIMTVLSTYVQRNNRLPCPAIAGDTGTGAGTERKDGKDGHCYNNSSVTKLYEDTQGILPWRTLGIPESMARDSWGRLITYKPAPQLTVDTFSAAMQNRDAASDPLEDIHNACRGLEWFTSSDGLPVHINRGQALFCCNAVPKKGYLPSGVPTGWEKQSLRAAGQGKDDSVIATAAWMDKNDDTKVNGAFDAPRHSSYGKQTTALADSPLIRASTNAVTLISQGSNGLLAFILGSNAVQQSGSRLVSPTEKADATDYANTAGSAYNPKLSSNTYDITGRLSGASDNIVAYIRSDQLYAKAGQASCRPSLLAPSCTTTPTSASLKDVTYLVDSSGSMDERLKACSNPADTRASCKQSRLQITKQALYHEVNDKPAGFLSDYVNMKMKSLNPDKTYSVGLNYFNDKNTGAEFNTAKGLYDIFGQKDADGNLAGPDGVQDALDTVGTVADKKNDTVNGLKNLVGDLKADGATPLAQSLIDTATAMKDGDEDEKNGIVLISDGANNANVKVPSLTDDNKFTIFPATRKVKMGPNPNDPNDIEPIRNADGTLILCSSGKGCADYDFFGMEMATDYISKKFPNLKIFVVDMSGETGKSYTTGMGRIASRTGGAYRQAILPKDLEDIFNGLLLTPPDEACK